MYLMSSFHVFDMESARRLDVRWRACASASGLSGAGSCIRAFVAAGAADLWKGQAWVEVFSTAMHRLTVTIPWNWIPQ